MSILTLGNIRFIPSIHQRIAFAEELRRAMLEFMPDVIAVELPPGLSDWIVRGVLRLPQISAVCMEIPGSDRVETVPIDPCDSMIEAIRLGLENDIPIEWIDVDGESGKYPEIDLPDDLMIESTGLERYVETVMPYLGTTGPGRLREQAMAQRLMALDDRGIRILCVLGMAHFPGVRSLLMKPKSGLADVDSNAPGSGSGRTYLTHIAPSSIPEVLREIPWIAAQRESFRTPLGTGEGRAFDKLLSVRELLKTAEPVYEERYRLQINLTQQKALYQFMRNLALVQGRLGPDLYSLVMSAKGTVDGDFGYEVYELARSYLLQERESGLPMLEVEDGVGRLEGREEPVDVDSRFGRPPTEKISLHFRRRPNREMREVWKEQWNAESLYGICSWPPEDETQEKFMDFIRKRALAVLGQDRRQVQEFTTSLLDGLDIRETLRNWHTKKLYVQQTPQPQGSVGAVVVIFEDESLDDQFTWRCTLYAENNNESDISFYATPLGQEVVGPQIARTQFGGLLSIFPASQIPDIWRFPGVEELRSCAEALLAAGILFSENRYVAFVSASPPSSRMKQLASEYGKHIIYLPVQNFSRTQLRKVRKFHILNGHQVRRYAADYIFDD